MKIVSWFILFALTMNVFASTGSLQGLEQALDEYQYALTVEWDQKDLAKKDALSLAFAEKLQALIQDQGLTKEEINTVLESRVKNKEQLAAMKAKLALMGKATSAEHMVELLNQNSKDLYAQGANWNGSGEVLMYVGIGLLVAGVIWFYATHECVAYGEEWRCDSTSDGYNSSSRCRWVTVCTAWQKK